MKGLIKLTPESLIALTTECMDYVNDFDIEPCKTVTVKWSWLKLRNVENTYYDAPFWYQYKSALKAHFYKLYKIYEQANKHGDEIWLSELSYANMCLLKDRHREANPLYIMNY